MKKYLLLAVLLSGCSSFERLRPDLEAKPPPSRLDEIAYINSLRRAYTYNPVEADGDSAANCYNGADLKRFNPELSEGYASHAEDHEAISGNNCVFFRKLTDENRKNAINDYLDAGFGLTDLYCQRFFIVAVQAAQKRRFQRDTGTTVDGLVGSVLGLAGAGETALGITNAGFAAIDSTYKNIDTAFLVAPDMANVRKLVLAAHAEFRTEAFKADNLPGTYAGARSVIERYAGLCSYTGMKQLVDVSVQSQASDLTESAAANKDKPNPTPPAGTPAVAGQAAGTGTTQPAASGNRPPTAEAVPTTSPQD